MKQIFLMLCIFFMLLTFAHAGELYNCIDRDGVKIITDSPQDGMKCTGGESREELKRPKTYSHTNSVDTCSRLSRELDDISIEINTLEKSRSALQREQLDARQKEAPNNWNQRSRWEKTNPLNDKMYKLNNELSILYQKKSVINQDMRLYKCNEINSDLSKLNQKESNSNQYNKNNKYRNR